MFVERFKELIDIYFVLLCLGLGFVLFFIDKRGLEEKGLEKERKIAVGSSIALFIIGPLTYVIKMLL